MDFPNWSLSSILHRGTAPSPFWLPAWIRERRGVLVYIAILYPCIPVTREVLRGNSHKEMIMNHPQLDRCTWVYPCKYPSEYNPRPLWPQEDGNRGLYQWSNCVFIFELNLRTFWNILICFLIFLNMLWTGWAVYYMILVEISSFSHFSQFCYHRAKGKIQLL